MSLDDISEELRNNLYFGFLSDTKLDISSMHRSLILAKLSLSIRNTPKTGNHSHSYVDIRLDNIDIVVGVLLEKNIIDYVACSYKPEPETYSTNTTIPINRRYSEEFIVILRALQLYCVNYLNKCKGIKLYNLDIDLLRYW